MTRKIIVLGLVLVGSLVPAEETFHLRSIAEGIQGAVRRKIETSPNSVVPFKEDWNATRDIGRHPQGDNSILILGGNVGKFPAVQFKVNSGTFSQNTDAETALSFMTIVKLAPVGTFEEAKEACAKFAPEGTWNLITKKEMVFVGQFENVHRAMVESTGESKVWMGDVKELNQSGGLYKYHYSQNSRLKESEFTLTNQESLKAELARKIPTLEFVRQSLISDANAEINGILYYLQITEERERAEDAANFGFGTPSEYTKARIAELKDKLGKAKDRIEDLKNQRPLGLLEIEAAYKSKLADHQEMVNSYKKVSPICVSRRF